MSANRDEVMAEIRALLVKNFRLNGEDITPESTLKSLDLDSIDFIDLISELERNRTAASPRRISRSRQRAAERRSHNIQSHAGASRAPAAPCFSLPGRRMRPDIHA